MNYISMTTAAPEKQAKTEWAWSEFMWSACGVMGPAVVDDQSDVTPRPPIERSSSIFVNGRTSQL